MMEETQAKREAEAKASVREARPEPDEIYVNATGRVTLPEGAIVITPGGKRYIVEGTNLRLDMGNRATRRQAAKMGKRGR